MATEEPQAISVHRVARAIIAATCAGTGVEPEDALGNSRLPRIVEVRHRAMRAVKGATGWSFPRVGQIFKRDHTTILHAWRKQDRPIEDMRPIRRPPGYVPPAERAAQSSRLDRMLAHQRADKGDLLSTHVPIYPVPDPIDPVVPGSRFALSMRDDERRQLARLLFIHGPNCFRPFNVDTSAPRKVLQDLTGRNSQSQEHLKCSSVPNDRSTKWNDRSSRSPGEFNQERTA